VDGAKARLKSLDANHFQIATGDTSGGKTRHRRACHFRVSIPVGDQGYFADAFCGRTDHAAWRGATAPGDRPHIGVPFRDSDMGYASKSRRNCGVTHL